MSLSKSGSSVMKPSVVQETIIEESCLFKSSERVLLMKLVIHPAYKGLINAPDGRTLVVLEWESYRGF